MKEEEKRSKMGGTDDILILRCGKQQSARKYSSGEATARTRDESTVQKEQRAALGGDKSVFGGSREHKDWLRGVAARERSNSENQNDSMVREEQRAALGGDKSAFGGSREQKDWFKSNSVNQNDPTDCEERRAALGDNEGVFDGSTEHKDWLRGIGAREERRWRMRE